MRSVKIDESFEGFLKFFPEEKLPLSFTEENVIAFSTNNRPLSIPMLQRFILPIEAGIDDLTEFIPCAKIPNTSNFHAVVYWRGGLMDYQYVLATYTKEGDIIDKKVIGGTFYDGKLLTRSVSIMKEDWSIQVLTGQSEDINTLTYDAANSKAVILELMPDGEIKE